MLPGYTVSGLTTLGLWPEATRPDAAATVCVAGTDDWLGAIAAGPAVPQLVALALDVLAEDARGTG